MNRPVMMSTEVHAQRHATIRVLVANLSGALAEAVTQAITQQTDMVLVDIVHDRVDLLLAVTADVHVLVFGAADVHHLPPVCTHLLGEFPDLRIVVLSLNGSAAVTYWLGLRRHTVGLPAPHSILTGIRRAYQLNPTA
jgi:hypothetical protein